MFQTAPETAFHTLPVNVIDRNSVLKAFSTQGTAIVVIRTQLFLFLVQWHSRSRSVVKFSEGRKYTIITGREEMEMVAVILTTKMILLAFSSPIQAIIKCW